MTFRFLNKNRAVILIRIILCILVVVHVFISCDQPQSVDEKSYYYIDSVQKKEVTQTDTNIGIIKAPEIIFFNYSECKSNCFYPKKIQTIKYFGDTLLLRIGSIENCVGKFRSEIEIRDSVLNIIIEPNSFMVQKNRGGKMDTIYSITECDCFFYFDMKIKNLFFEPKKILVNGSTKNIELKEVIVPKDM